MTEKHPDIGNNWVAACVAMWSNTMPKEEIIELMVRKFDIRLMEEMNKRINSFEEKLTEVGGKKIVMSTDGVSSTMADRLYEKVLNLKFKVVFYVPFADLSKVPGVKTDSPAAECAPAVSTRLSVVEQRTEDIYEVLRRMANRGEPRPGRDILQCGGWRWRCRTEVRVQGEESEGAERGQEEA